MHLRRCEKSLGYFLTWALHDYSFAAGRDSERLSPHEHLIEESTERLALGEEGLAPAAASGASTQQRDLGAHVVYPWSPWSSWTFPAIS